MTMVTKAQAEQDTEGFREPFDSPAERRRYSARSPAPLLNKVGKLIKDELRKNLRSSATVRQRSLGRTLLGVTVLVVGGLVVPMSPASASNSASGSIYIPGINLESFITSRRGVAIDPAGTFAYVTNPVSNEDAGAAGTISRINLATNTVGATITVGLSPKSVAINPAGTFAYVVNDEPGMVPAEAGTVSRINLASNAVDATIKVGFGSDGVAINPAGTFAYVANADSGTVSRINLATNVVDATIKVGKGAVGVAINPTGTFAYITITTGESPGMVSRINLATNAVDGTTIKVGQNPKAIAINPAGTFAYVAHRDTNTVFKINLVTNTVDATITVGFGSEGMAINPTGTFAYVTNSMIDPSGFNTVSRINLATNVVDATIKVGKGAVGVAINPTGTFAYVMNNDSGTISRINLATNTVDATIVVGKHLHAVTMSKPISATTLAGWAQFTVPKGAAISLRVESSSAKYCKVSGSTLKGVKAGWPCTVTVTVKSKAGKSESKKGTLAVTK